MMEDARRVADQPHLAAPGEYLRAILVVAIAIHDQLAGASSTTIAPLPPSDVPATPSPSTKTRTRKRR